MAPVARHDAYAGGFLLFGLRDGPAVAEDAVDGGFAVELVRADN
jgi:hypothetical protein